MYRGGSIAGARDAEGLSLVLNPEGLYQISVTLDSTRGYDLQNDTITTLRKGLVLGKLTANDKYCAFKHQTLASGGAAAGQKVIPVDNVEGFKAGDSLLATNAGGESETRVIDTISETEGAGNITVTVNLTYTYADGDVVYLKMGSELDVNAVILDEEVEDADEADQVVSAIWAGKLRSSAIVNADRLTKTNVQRLEFPPEG